MQRILNPIIKYTFVALLLVATSSIIQAQYAKGNSPYSRYGFGDLSNGMLVANQSMGGGMAATYRNFWNVNLVNPASLGSLRFTAFQLGINYEHHALSEKNTGLTAVADNGNLNYISLAFPITKSWEILKDTLRRGVPIQWGMGFSLLPYSSRNYDVSVKRTVGTIPNVKFNYKGSGNKYRVNWANGFTYKGLSAGANIGLLFGKVSNSTIIDFQDSSYILGYDERFLSEEYGAALTWDIGFQYEYGLAKKEKNTDEYTSLDFKRKITLGAYMGSISDIKTFSTLQYTRQGLYTSIDSIRNVSDVEGTINMPLKIGGGVAIGSESDWQIGASFESQLWSMYKVNGRSDANIKDSWRVAIGGQWIPKLVDYSNYLNRIHYRFGLHYANDPRAIVASDGVRYQLVDYGLSVGAGFPLKSSDRKRTIGGFVNLGLDVGYMGHPELIGDVYFKVNLGFALNAGGWFTKSKFR